jgi:hypothetical protein
LEQGRELKYTACVTPVSQTSDNEKVKFIVCLKIPENIQQLNNAKEVPEVK